MRIAIIGGGAAGLMAAASMLEHAPTAEVFVLEKNDSLGKKVVISGGGRCNVTTGIMDVRTVLTKYPRGGKFLTSAMHRFPPAAVMAWFQSRGVPLKVEEDLRVFPVSDNGHDIVRVFEEIFRRSDVHVMLRAEVSGVRRGEDGKGFLIDIKDHREPLAVDTVVLTTGGQAYRHTGSTGDGYAFALSLGHTLTPLGPSLNAFFTKEKWPAEVSGLSFEAARITAKRGKGVSFTGPFLFTHRGVSGPAVFALSSLTAFEPYGPTNPMEITVDLFPDMVADTLLAAFEERIAEAPAKSLKNLLATFVPKSLADIGIRELGLADDKRGSETAKKDLRRVTAWLKGIPLTVVQRGGGDEFVTAGGIPTTEIDPSTMESRICPGLYFAGEIMDVDGFTGGFNLQASWAAGHLAGESIADAKSAA
jgi:hypothetical protein